MRRLALLLLCALAGCAESGHAFVIAIDGVPPETTTIDSYVDSEQGEVSRRFADVARLTDDGAGTLAIVVPEGSTRIEVVVEARKDDCVIARGQGSCGLADCAALRVTLVAHLCGPGPDAGGLDDGRD
ncbi:MAG: hypothetical protein IT370_25565 [Deltaproteobacteria bacterium]|nr:hypothetical protein [Deltaproteobacteria bacterium]